ncbi:hypothetical protein C8A01DRAFT_12627 [Parachaetomium inaequale]|uniref:Protein kinase domain-containing protein n=1 Tax=Parachaetomium inaequale TaxID=2588326 RepID=A0AAN6PS45_9PEZI|nr:hypothetical protein C8A01DRAFT_12627 [Parachaetomium inaequale]
MAAQLTFQELQKRSNYRFECYRTTAAQPREDVDYQTPAYHNFACPKPGFYPGVQPVAQLFSAPLYPSLHPSVHDPVQGLPPAMAADVKAARERVRARLLPRRLEWSKDLGVGGNGLASLFSINDATHHGNRRRYFVAKANHRQTASANAALAREQALTDRFRHAMHVVQSPDWASVPVRDQWRPAQVPPPTDVMLLEYCERGSLYKALCTAQTRGLKFPERALWHMFHCLIQACVAMAHPPQNNLPLYGINPPNAPDRLLMEKISDSEDPDPFVHFDIDPQNILVGKNEPGSDHPLIPGLQLSDFGLAEELEDWHYTDNQYMLELRRMAKDRYFTPEQFSAQWDWIPLNEGPGTMNPRPEVAGNYGWKSNLFQMALVMASLITRCYPYRPPIPGWTGVPGRPLDPWYYGEEDDMDEDDSDDDMDDYHDGDNDGYDDDGYLRVWTYGRYLLDQHENDKNKPDAERRYGHVSFDLVWLVAACLCDNPRYRPGLSWLEAKVSGHIERKWGGGRANNPPDNDNSDGRMRDFIRDCFDSPPPSAPGNGGGGGGGGGRPGGRVVWERGRG